MKRGLGNTVKRRDFLLSSGLAGAGWSACTARGELRHSNPAPQNWGASPNVMDPSYIDPRLDCRSVSAENPTGARGAGGREGGGRKGRPSLALKPGETVVLAELRGPGTVRHIWAAVDFATPEIARALRLEVFYDGRTEPSISVPLLDFFCLPHGRRAEYYSALSSVPEGLGLNSYIPMPFGQAFRMVLTNESTTSNYIFYQVDYTLEQQLHAYPGSYLHATFRRENPTVRGRDFLIADGFKGPGRYLGACVGIRVLERDFWFGEGEVKIYRDWDHEFPTYCGTGLEDYVGSAYNLGRFYGPYSGAPLVLPVTADAHRDLEKRMPRWVSFYRWHLLDPIMFDESIRVTVQQLGAAFFKPSETREFEEYRRTHRTSPLGWIATKDFPEEAYIERQDDYCGTAFVYCAQPQSVSPYSTELATQDLSLSAGETRFDPMASDK